MSSPNRPSSRSRAAPPPPLSLEAALDEERLEVMKALEGSKRTASPSTRKHRTATPPPPVRSMLDVDSPTPRHGSIAGIGVGVTSPHTSPSQTRKKDLNPADPSTWTSRHTSFSTNTSPTEERSSARPRATSDTANQRQGLPKIPDIKTDIEQDYQFDVSSAAPASAAPKRNTQGGKRPREGSGQAMAAVLSGDFSSLHVGLAKGAASGRHNSTAGITGHSKSPSSRIRRPASPGMLSPSSPPSKYVTESGKAVDMNKAYRRLSNKSKSDGSFSTVTSGSDEVPARIEKDDISEEDEAAVDSSEEDSGSSGDDLSDTGISRGRRRGRRKKSLESDVDWDESAEDSAGTARQAQSQMAAAEEERKQVSSTQPVKSLLEPAITLTSPTGENIIPKKTGVHPTNAYDHAASVATSAASSEGDPEMADIVKARKLGINVSAVDSTVPDRVVQIILRGDWGSMQMEADDERRRQRLYLVASDLSDEAVYALEWTIGTILRDGDTLLAMYAIEDENATGKPNERDYEALQAEGTRVAKDVERDMERLTRKTEQNPIAATSLSPATFQPATEADSVAGSVDARRVPKNQMDRLRAADNLRTTCLKLVRKTRLQVRIMVEVIHCKSPKHLITGAIDELEPTLVVLGSRGRSALKGTLLGSMSNYIVTKSSVPVMVARRKLRKRDGAKGKPVAVRLTNNLVTPGAPQKRKSLKDANVEYNIYRRK